MISHFVAKSLFQKLPNLTIRSLLKIKEGIKLKRHIFTIFLFAFLSLLPVFAQVSVDTEDDFYTDATAWFLKGYIQSLPQLKPYPINIINDLLDEVIANAPQAEQVIAEYYKDKYFSKKISASSDTNANIKLKFLDSGSEEIERFTHNEFFSENIAVAGDIPINEKAGIAFDLSGRVYYSRVPSENVFPLYTFGNDINKKNALKINADKVDFALNPNFIATFGKQNLYATIGMNKTGFGLFQDDGLIMNPSTYQAINATINYQGKYVSISRYLGLLAADKEDGSFGYSARKFISFHSMKIPIPKAHISFSLYESIIISKPFNPVYLWPIPYCAAANLLKFDENVISGLNFEWKPLHGIAILMDFIIDDIENVKSLFKLKLNDAGIRTGFKMGFIYAPFDSACNFLSLNYTLITPYTYTRYAQSDDKYHYLDYTNFGMSLGSNLPPNSDRVNLTIHFKPMPNFKVQTFSSFIRHANSYESLSPEEAIQIPSGYPSNGSISADTRGFDSVKNVTGFLKQDTTMYIVQAGTFLEYEFILKKAGRISISAQYIYEYISNNGVDSNIYSGNYTAETEQERIEQANRELKAWKNKLHDSHNHYFTIGVKYRY
ncbi:MAG: hypothetical protein HDR57_00905 [Treponema sp.]|nr:hypothetical protein [Treponema sp.]